MGESRGHWEGNTLVIVTTNFKAGASATNIGVMGSPEGNRFPTSEQMKTTERITRLNDDFLLYEIKTEDPLIITRPWTRALSVEAGSDRTSGGSTPAMRATARSATTSTHRARSARAQPEAK